MFTATLSEKSQGVTTIVTDKETIEIARWTNNRNINKMQSNNTGDVYKMQVN